MPEGAGQALTLANEAEKFSLGDMGLSFASSTVWVMLLYGIFINLTNFGIDQNFVQRCHAGPTLKSRRPLGLMGALLYMPVALMFFFIGSILFSYYQAHPALLEDVRLAKATELVAEESPGLAKGSEAAVELLLAAAMELTDYNDNVLPHFIAKRIPAGLAGLLIAALFAAAMSSIDTSLNSSSTIALQDFYRRWFRPGATEAESLRFLRIMTVVFGLIGTSVALAMMGVKSILDAWWKISGVFAGGMLGLFLLGFISRRATNAGAALGATIGVLVILWMTFTPDMEGELGWFRSPFHST